MNELACCTSTIGPSCGHTIGGQSVTLAEVAQVLRDGGELPIGRRPGGREALWCFDLNEAEAAEVCDDFEDVFEVVVTAGAVIVMHHGPGPRRFAGNGACLSPALVLLKPHEVAALAAHWPALFDGDGAELLELQRAARLDALRGAA